MSAGRDRQFFEKFFFWDVAIFSNSKLILTDPIYRCYYCLLFSIIFLKRDLQTSLQCTVCEDCDFINLYNNSFDSP